MAQEFNRPNLFANVDYYDPKQVIINDTVGTIEVSIDDAADLGRWLIAWVEEAKR